jgi:tetratricopeptide (TPR) repeat protein
MESPVLENESSSEKPKLIIRFLDGFITFGIMALFFGLPVFFLGLTFQGLAFEKQMYFYFWTMLTLIAWAVKGVILGEMRIKRTPLDIPIAIFWVIYLLAAIFSVDKWHSFWGFFGDPSRGLMSITAMIFAYFIIVSHFTEKRLQKIIGAFLASGLLASVWIFLQIFAIKFLPASVMAFVPLSLTGSLSGFGTFLSVLLPVAMVAVFKTGMNEYLRGGLKKILLILLGLLIALDLFLLFVFFNFISFPILLAGLVIFLVYILSMIVRPSGNLFWIPMVVFVAVLTFWMVGPVAGKIIKINLPVEVSPTYAMSWHVTKGTLQSGVANFVLGSGPATYGYDFSRFRPQEFNANQLYNLRFYQGTGMFFEYLSTIGVLGSIAFAILFLTFVSFTIYFLSREKEKNKIYSLGILSASFVLLFNVLLGRAEGSMLVLAALLGALAVATVLHEGEAEVNYLNLSLKASPKFALTLAFIFMMVSAGAVFLFVYLGKVVTAEFVMGAIAREQKLTDQSLSSVSNAIGMYGKEGRYYAQWGQMFMILANEEMLKGEGNRDVNKIQSYLNNSISASKAGNDLMKNDVASVESLALVYENAGLYVPNSLNLAEETYKLAQTLEPLNPNFSLKLGQIKEAVAVGKKDEAEKKQLIGEAKDLFQKSVDLKKDFGPGYYNLALTKEALGDLNGAIEDMSLAVQANRQDINYWFNLARLYQTRGKDQDNQFAEALFKQILGVNSKEVNSHFYLALLYEKTEKKDKAIEEYQAVLDLLPADNEATRGKIEEMIANLKSGRSNLTTESAPVDAGGQSQVNQNQ